MYREVEVTNVVELLIELTALQRLRAAWQSMPQGHIPALQLEILDDIIARKEAARESHFEELEDDFPEIGQFM